jgi:hypothetical protein
MSWLSLLVALLPAFALLTTLAFGCYPGERSLARAARSVRPRPRTSTALRGALIEHKHERRRGALLSGALAGRSPPAAAGRAL